MLNTKNEIADANANYLLNLDCISRSYSSEEMSRFWFRLLKQDFHVSRKMLPFLSKYSTDLLRKIDNTNQNDFYHFVSFFTEKNSKNPIKSYPQALLRTIYHKLYRFNQLLKEGKVNDKFLDYFDYKLILLVCAADSKDTDLAIFKTTGLMKFEDWFELSLHLECNNLAKLFISKSFDPVLNEKTSSLEKVNAFYEKRFLDLCARAGNVEMFELYLNRGFWEEKLSTHFSKKAMENLFFAMAASVMITGMAGVAFSADEVRNTLFKFSNLASSPYLKYMGLGSTALGLSLSAVHPCLEYLEVNKYLSKNKIRPDEQTLVNAIYSENKILVDFLLDDANTFNLSVSKAYDFIVAENVNSKLIPIILERIIKNENALESFFSQVNIYKNLDKLKNSPLLFSYAHKMLNYILKDCDRFKKCIKNNETLRIVAQFFPTISVLQKENINEVLIALSTIEMKKGAMVLVKTRRDISHPIFAIPDELLVEILAKTADSEVHDEDQARQICMKLL